MKKRMRRIKRITATVLAVLMIGTTIDLSALATVAATEIPDFSEAKVLTEEGGILYIDGEVDQSVYIPAGNYKLGESIITDKYFMTVSSVNLDLNGYTWNMSKAYLELQGSATVSLYDTSAEQTGMLTSSSTRTISLSGAGTTFNLYSGTVENTFENEIAEGVACFNGSCNLYGGKIKSNAYAVYFGLGEDSIINLDGTLSECGEGHGQLATWLDASATPHAVIDVSDYIGTSLAVDAEINEVGKIKIFQGIQSAQDAEKYTVNVSSDYDFFLEKEEYDGETGEKYVYVSAPSFTQQPTSENGYAVSFNHPDATLQWYEYNVLERDTYSQITEWELIASYEVKTGDELFLSAGSDDFWLSLRVGEEGLTLNGDTKTASVSFASDTTVEVQVTSHCDNVSELKLEHIRYTELAGKTGTDLHDSECGTTYICKATVDDKVYYSDTVKREHNCKYSASGAVISGLCTECGNTIGTITISAEGGIYNGTAVTANVTNAIDDADYSTSIVYKDSTGAVVDEAVNAGTYTANLTLRNADSTEVTASCGFEITKETAVVEVPAATAITYGQTLSEATLSSGWSWGDGTTVPTVTNNGYAAVKTVSDYENVDYSALGNGFTYDETAHTLTYTVAVTVSQANAPILLRGSKAYVYNQSFEGESVSITGLPTDCGKVLYSLQSMSGDMLENILVNASSGEITYDVKALDSYTEDLQATISVNVIMGNYETAIYALDITRTEKISQIISAENLSLTYGDAGKKIVAETNGDGTLSYVVATGGDVLSVATDGTVTIYKAGSATVKITAAATDAYGAAETTIAVTVDKAENAPNLPYATMNVSYDTETVGAATLPNGWAWEATDVSNVLIVGEAVNAIAVYKGADAGNYEIETVEVAITRSACSHSDTEIRDASEASCTADGYTGDTYCKDCGECVSAGQGIPAPGHDYKSEVTTEATTSNEGVRTYTCEKCSDSYTERIPKLPAPTPTVAPTSTPTSVPVPTEPPSPTPTLAPTSTPTPAPVPTATPEPTPTLAPTSTPTVTPIPEEDGKKPETEEPEVKEPVLKKGYTVQIGAFSSETNAKKWEQKGEAIGIPMFIIEDGKYLKVQTDVYETGEEAVAVAKKLAAAGLDNFILKTERWVTPEGEEAPEEPTKPEVPVLPPETDKKTIEALAKEVIAGKWGNGTERKNRLTEAGYNYREVQDKVNELLQ